MALLRNLAQMISIVERNQRRQRVERQTLGALVVTNALPLLSIHVARELAQLRTTRAKKAQLLADFGARIIVANRQFAL